MIILLSQMIIFFEYARGHSKLHRGLRSAAAFLFLSWEHYNLFSSSLQCVSSSCRELFSRHKSFIAGIRIHEIHI